MPKFRKLRTSHLLLLVGSLLTASAYATENAAEEIKACARVSDRDTRIACYEALGQRLLADERSPAAPRETESVAAAKPATVAAAKPAVAEAAPDSNDEPKLPADLGGAQFKGEASTDKSARGIVTSCDKGSNGKYYFFFNNGQVWKQVDNKRQRFKECSFEVSIARDAFGYKMSIESLDKSVRVKRRK